MLQVSSGSKLTDRYAFICFGGAGIWTAVPIFLSWMVTMFNGREKRAIAIALINGVGECAIKEFIHDADLVKGALSSVYGAFFWPAQDAPEYVMGFALTTALIVAVAVAVALMRYFFGDRGVISSSRTEVP